MNRTTTSLLATTGALLALTGLAAVGTGDESDAPDTHATSVTRAVERTTLTCPRPTHAEVATTWYTAYTPETDAVAEGDRPAGTAELLPAPEYAPGTERDQQERDGGDEGRDGGQDGKESDGERPDPVAPLAERATPVTVSTDDTAAPALTGTADGLLAPGWTVQQTTRIEAGGRGLLGTACQAPDTSFWFAGASTADSRRDYVHLTNPDEAATVVDIELYGPDGQVEAEAGQGITVPGHSSVPVLLSTLTDEPVADLAVEVTARTGRIGAQIEAVDDRTGADWLPPAAPARGRLVLPGIPADATGVKLVVFAPGEEDVTLDVGLAGPSGVITPAGNDSVSVPAGTLTVVDFGNLTQDEAGSLVLTPAAGSGSGPVVAALRVVTGDERREMAFVPATGPVELRGTVAGNTADGTQLLLTAPGKAAEVEVTVSAGSDGGQPATERLTVDPGTTLAHSPELPDDTKGRYALTVTRTGGGPLYAARVLTGDTDDDAEDGGVPFTVQTVPDDRSTVTVPGTDQDLSVLLD